MAEYLMDYIYGELDNRTVNAVCWKRYTSLPKADVLNYMRYAIMETNGTDVVYQCRKIEGEYVWIKQTNEDLLKAITELGRSLSKLSEEVAEIKKQGKGDKGDTGAQGPQGIPGEPRDLRVDGTSVVDPTTHIANLTTNNFVEAGDNVSIDGKKISAVDTTYTVVEPLHISDDNVISVNSEALECKIDEDWTVKYDIGGYFYDEKIDEGTTLKDILKKLLTLPQKLVSDSFYIWTTDSFGPTGRPDIADGTEIQMDPDHWRQGFIRFHLDPNHEYECFAYPMVVTIDGREQPLKAPTKIWDNDDSDYNMVNDYEIVSNVNYGGKLYYVCWYPELLKANNDITTVFWR